MTAGRRASGHVAVVLTATVACAVTLGRAGHDALAPPPMTTDPAALRAWIEARDPITAVLALGRVAALALAAYLLVAITVGVMVRLVARAIPAGAGLVRLFDALLPRALRGLLDAGFGAVVTVASLGLTFGPNASAAIAPGSALRAATATLTPSSPSPTTTTEPPPVLRRVPPEPSSVPAVAPLPADPAPSETRAQSGRAWTVQRGEHFWSIAEAVVASHTPGRLPTEREIAQYWRRLIADNRHRLPVPGNPDLLYPGTVLRLP